MLLKDLDKHRSFSFWNNPPPGDGDSGEACFTAKETAPSDFDLSIFSIFAAPNQLTLWVGYADVREFSDYERRPRWFDKKSEFGRPFAE